MIELGDSVHRICGHRQRERGIVLRVDGMFCFVFGRWFHQTTLKKV